MHAFVYFYIQHKNRHEWICLFSCSLMFKPTNQPFWLAYTLQARTGPTTTPEKPWKRIHSPNLHFVTSLRSRTWWMARQMGNKKTCWNEPWKVQGTNPWNKSSSFSRTLLSRATFFLGGTLLGSVKCYSSFHHLPKSAGKKNCDLHKAQTLN